MSSLTGSFKITSFSSSGNMSLWDIPVAFLLFSPAMIIGIATMWQFLRQKISDEITAHDTRIAKAHDDLTKEAQKILSMVNNLTTRLNVIEEACRNDFSTINASIETLQNEMIRQYAVVRRIQPIGTDQMSTVGQSETSSQSHASSSGSSGKQFGIYISYVYPMTHNSLYLQILIQ
jgi:hypothetical protein